LRLGQHQALLEHDDEFLLPDGVHDNGEFDRLGSEIGADAIARTAGQLKNKLA